MCTKFLIRHPMLLTLCLAAASCTAPISVHRVTPARPTPVVVGESALERASKSGESTALFAAGETLDALRLVYERVAAGDSAALPEYNYLTARLVERLVEAGVKPWQNELAIPTGRTRYVLRGTQPDDLGVTDRHFVSADSVEFTGDYAKTKAIENGAGAPMLAVLDAPRGEFESFDKKFRYRIVTAVVSFSGSKATIDLKDPYETEFVQLGGRRYPLGADYGIAASYALSETRIDKLGIRRLIFPARFDKTARLSRLQPYDPDRIPVLFVHGLQDTPASFAPMYLSLMADPEIRKRYQFWAFSYPSGYPYPYSASLLRKELDRMQQEFPGHKDIVIAGHSMGGLLTRLMLTDAGDDLWTTMFGKAPAETRMSGSSKQLLEDSLVFESRKDIGRAIFLSAPHRGSKFASNWIGRLGSKLVRIPNFIAETRDATVSLMTVDAAAMVLNRAPNSIDTLAPNNRFILEINKLPIVEGVPYHSIIGDRGKGDTPDSSDGVVDYWSSHLDGAVSEKIVPSDHSSQRSPEGIAEVRRILRLHAGLAR